MENAELDHKCIPLVGGRNFALVDIEDYDRLSAHRWYEFPYPRGKFRAATFVFVDGKKTTVYMHRMVMNVGSGDDREVDHKNSSATLDNRKSNLRFSDRSGQVMNRGRNRNNSSGFKNVCLDKRRGRYRAYIVLNRKQIHLGYADTAEEAYMLYVEQVQNYHGEFSNIGKI